MANGPNSTWSQIFMSCEFKAILKLLELCKKETKDKEAYAARIVFDQQSLSALYKNFPILVLYL